MLAYCRGRCSRCNQLQCKFGDLTVVDVDVDVAVAVAVVVSSRWRIERLSFGDGGISLSISVLQ